jgi:hypothetical protein
MKRRMEISMARGWKPHCHAYRNFRMKWGLSSQLPRWRAFDGLRSQLAASWAANR